MFAPCQHRRWLQVGRDLALAETGAGPGSSGAAHWQNWKPLGICGRVGRAPARDALCRGFDPCRRRPRGLAVDFGPTPSGWLIHQLGSPRLGALRPPGWRGPPRRLTVGVRVPAGHWPGRGPGQVRVDHDGTPDSDWSSQVRVIVIRVRVDHDSDGTAAAGGQPLGLSARCIVIRVRLGLSGGPSDRP